MPTDLTVSSQLPEQRESDIEPQGPDQDLIDRTLEFVRSRKPVLDQAHQAYIQAFDNFDLTESEVKVEIGKFLFENYFNSDKSLVEGGDFHPYKKRSYDALEASSEWPFKRTTVRNMLKCAVQDQWLRSTRIRIDHLNFTHQVRLTRLPNDDVKKQLIKRIRDEQMSTRDLEYAINQIKTKGKTALPETFNDIIEGYDKWMAPLLEEEFIVDLTKAKNNDPNEPVALSRRKEMRKTLSDMIEKFEQALALLQSAKATLKRPRQIGSKKASSDNESATPRPT